MNKSTVEQIRERFDGDVERFSNLETGQTATIDAPLSLALIAGAASRVTPGASSLLDVGCGAGNHALKILERLPNLDVTLIDLSRPMLDRASERVSQATSGKVIALQGDVRDLHLGDSQFDIICAAAVLHHLRETAEWQSTFSKLHASLKTGGSLWISDLIEHSDSRVQSLMWERYGALSVTAKRRGLSRPGLCLRRTGRLPATIDVSVGSAAFSRVQSHRNLTQEQLFCRFWRN